MKLAKGYRNTGVMEKDCVLGGQLLSFLQSRLVSCLLDYSSYSILFARAELTVSELNYEKLMDTYLLDGKGSLLGFSPLGNFTELTELQCLLWHVLLCSSSVSFHLNNSYI